MSETDRDGKTHKLSLYRDDSGALVFGAGTVQWSWGLDGNHDLGSDDPDPNMQQATVNLFADMGVQPGNLQSDLQPATASDDETAPTSTIISPEDGDTVEEGEPVHDHRHRHRRRDRRGRRRCRGLRGRRRQLDPG